MKKVIMLLLLFVSLFLVNTSESFSNCENQGCDSTYTNERVFLELPDYPGCPIEFLYQWRRCNDTVEISMVGFAEPDSTGPCSFLYDSLLSIFGNPNWIFMRNLLEKARVELVKHNFMQEYMAAAPYDKFLYECPIGKKYYNYNWRKCTKWEYSYQIIHFGDFTFEGWFFSKVDCESYACCEEQISICFNTVTQQIEIFRALTSHVSGNCDDSGGTSTESGCSTPCEGIFIN